MKIDRVKLIVDGTAILIGLLLAVSLGLFAPLYSLTPAELAGAGGVAMMGARILVAYIASLPAPSQGQSDLTELFGGVAKTSELVQVLNLVTGQQKTQFDALMTKLTAALPTHTLVLGQVGDPVEVPEPIPSVPETVAPAAPEATPDAARAPPETVNQPA